ncbi:MAG TPA: YciI family protein [Ramlibacter sp.]|jgi:hypothetical protein|nr:YciI family protein [Ramlibacter sp.]
MLFAVIFRDKPDQGALRSQLLPAHIAWLDQVRDTVRVGGSLRTEPGIVPIGGLWIVEAASKDEIDRLMRADPFFTGGLRASWEILHWSKAFEDRTVPV